ncbi:maleylpyruvate isomerase N-terminal domain-containing protein [Streptomyces antimycoticus]|uniref:maleylpyruvate isomerase N-terminal domain-containing protein n=1 Tax=Streptomyces antimycoticus TaxID=68175 RepID=UPI003442B541
MILEAFRLQRSRFIETVSGFGPAEWQADSRCTDWSVHEVLRHVRDAAAIHVERLGGRHAVFTTQGAFHPATTPATWLAASSGESPADTLRDLISLVEEEDHLLTEKVERNPSETMPGPLRRTLHWSVFSLHFFWDAWIHERDIMLPLGTAPASTPTEHRLATMYGLLVAAAPASWSGDHVRTTVLLDGSPDGNYEVFPTSAGVMRAAVAPLGSVAELRGPMGEVVDSLAGRGPELGEVFDASPPSVSKLALLRKVAT